MPSPFWAAIRDASGAVIGPGPLTTLTSLDDTASLDTVGSASFTLPAADPRTALLSPGVTFDLHDEQDGHLGRFLFDDLSLSDSPAGEAWLTVTCSDVLALLSRHTVGFRRGYAYQDVAAVVADLVSLAPGWRADVEAGIGHTTVAYEGESVLVAVDELRDRWGRHYRLGAEALTLEFGAFGQDSGVILTNLPGQVQPEIGARREVAVVTSIRRVEEAGAIFNRVIPIGAGQGVSQLTIQAATVGDYPVLTGSNQDGSSFYYLQDEASIAAYGLRTKVLTMPNVRPLTNSAANAANAANVLKGTAEVFLARHRAPRVTYAVTAAALRKQVKVGDTVRLVYRGMVEGYRYIDIDQDFYAMDRTRLRSAGGERSASLVLSSIAERRTADSDVLLDVIHDLHSLKVHVPITLAYAPVGPYVRRINPDHEAEFTVRIREEVTALNRALLRFATAPLRSSVSATAAAESTVGSTSSGGGTTATSAAGGDHRHEIGYKLTGTFSGADQWYGIRINDNLIYEDALALKKTGSRSTNAVWETRGSSGPHTHDLTLPDHTHDVTVPAHSHAMQYDLYADDQVPAGISLEVDGVDVTTALGGPWAPTQAAVEVEVDITEALTEAPGGLRQNHRLTFSCGGGRGEIEAEVDLLLSIQAIAVEQE